jgi:acetyl-CoA acetyltransferase
MFDKQLAMVSVCSANGRARTRRAAFKASITIEDVLNSRMIAFPFRLLQLQCCLVTDGGSALILARPSAPATSRKNAV